MLRLKRCEVEGLPINPPSPRPLAAARSSALPRGGGGCAIAGTAALLTQADCLGDPQIHIELSRTTTVVAREQGLARGWVWIQQSVRCLDQARLSGPAAMPGRPLNRVVPNRSLPAVMSNGAPVCATMNGLIRTAHFKLIEPPMVKR